MRARGFTLPEAMIVVAIIGILAMFALPAMTSLLTTQAVRSSSYDLFADLIYARSEAISRGATVTVTGASGTDWKRGWNITVDAGATTLRSQPASGAALTFVGSQNAISYERTGRATNAAEVQFSIVPIDSGAQPHQKRCIKLDPSGRPRTAEGACP